MTENAAQSAEPADLRRPDKFRRHDQV